MARVTVEDCLEKLNNRFSLVHLSAKRVRQLRKGEDPLVICKNSDVVVSLREIAAGKVFPFENEEVSQPAEPEAPSDIAEDVAAETASESADKVASGEVQGGPERAGEES